MRRSYPKEWTEDDEAWLRENYSQRTARECAEHLSRSETAIRLRIHRLNNPLSQRRCVSVSRGTEWSAMDVARLQANYPLVADEVVAKLLGKGVRAVQERAAQLQLVKKPPAKMEWQLWLERRRVRPGMIYLMHGCGTGSYKIGFTRRDISERLSEMLMHSPVLIEVLGLVPGTLQDEANYHEKFAQFRSHGEWFLLPAEVLAGLLAEFAAKGQESAA